MTSLDELMHRVRAGDVSFADLWHASICLWAKIAHHHKICPGLEVEDLLQELAMVVWKAVYEWDPNRGKMSVSQFAIWHCWMRARLLASSTLRLQKNRVWPRFLAQTGIGNEDLVRLVWYESAMTLSSDPLETMRLFSVVRDLAMVTEIDRDRLGWN